MTQNLKSLTQKANSNKEGAIQEYHMAQAKLTAHAQNLHAALDEKQQGTKNSIRRIVRYTKWLLVSILACQILIVLFSPRLILEGKLKWMNSPRAAQSPITLKQLQQIQPTMNEADLAIIQALEALSAEHENRLIELENLLKGLHASGSTRSDQDGILIGKIEDFGKSQKELEAFVRRFVKHYRNSIDSIDSINARLDALENPEAK